MSIKFYKDNNIFKIDTENTSYVFRVMYDKYLVHLYYGERINDFELSYLHDGQIRSACVYPKEIGNTFSMDSSMLEFSYFGTGDNNISSLKLQNSFGDSNTFFAYKDYKIINGRININNLPNSEEIDNMQTLILFLKDKSTNLTLEMYYSVYKENDIITRYNKLINNSNNEVIIEKISSLCLDLDVNENEFLSLNGNYALERMVNKTKIKQGIFSLSSKRGISSHQTNPFLAVIDKNSTENYGNCYGIEFMYSGDFLIEAEKNPYGNTRVLASINPETFSWELKKDEEFYTPECILTFSNKGIGQMSRNFHNHIRQTIIRKNFVYKNRPVIVNTWEGSYYTIDENKLIEYAKKTKEIDADMIVLDDGWFSTRNDDSSGLGDWYLNKTKFPSGLKKIVNEINSYDIEFGIWMEPEMVNPNSELYKKHPEWVIQSYKRDLSLSRNQLCLDLSNEKVQEYIFDSIDKVLSLANIAYLKWDMNRPLSEVGSTSLNNFNQKEVGHRYIMGLYNILEKVTKKYPDLLIESCAGGGGRFDLGLLKYSPQIWTSDNTSPFERTFIQYGTSIAYPLSTISCHVTNGMNGGPRRLSTLNYRYQVASSGILGYELDCLKLSKEEVCEIRNQIIEYREVDNLILKGDLYRLKSPFETRFFAYCIVSDNKKEILVKVMQNNGVCNQKDPIIKLVGLKEDYIYEDIKNKNKYYGKTLMSVGIRCYDLNADGTSYVLRLKCVE